MQHLIAPLALAALILAIAVIFRSRDAYRDRAYGCLTRVGLERRWTGRGAVLFLDIDDMRGLNKFHGYREVDRRIREALAESCRAGEAVVARWASGDEIVIWLHDLEAAGHVQTRLQAAFARRGMSAMYGAARAQRSLPHTVAAASDRVQDLKRARDLALAVPS
jgi:GGDEF domain-containing protein